MAESCTRLFCPSAQPEMADAVILGVRGATADSPNLRYLDEPAPVTDGLLALTAPLAPTEVYRFAARCEEGSCVHFDGSDCRLATRIVQILPAVVDTLPACRIRPTCRWFLQEGRPACFRCPDIVTSSDDRSEMMARAATPQ
jgi:hypothetical protein